MREVSVRMFHFVVDLARTADLDEEALTRGLPSVALIDGKEPDWIDWDDFVELLERFERAAGGPEGAARAVRDALPTAYPELRAFAAVFLRPIPFFAFVMTRMMLTMYRHLELEEVERLGDDRVRWRQSIPQHYQRSEVFHRLSIPLVEVFPRHLELEEVERLGDDRVRWRQSIPQHYQRSEVFHRLSIPLVEVFPRHLELPEAKVEHFSIEGSSAEFVAKFPPSEPIAVRGARAVSSAASVLAVQLDEAFAKIAEALRARTEDANGKAPPSVPGAKAASGDVRDWAERLALSPRQRDVFALLIEGRANKDIAAALRCSERNVEFHVGRILRAAHVSSRAELLVKVLGART
jgi:DNA-binding CsgD family transcriptional regulator